MQERESAWREAVSNLRRACLAAVEVEEGWVDGGAGEGMWVGAGDVMREAVAVKWTVVEVGGAEEREGGRDLLFLVLLAPPLALLVAGRGGSDEPDAVPALDLVVVVVAEVDRVAMEEMVRAPVDRSTLHSSWGIDAWAVASEDEGICGGGGGSSNHVRPRQLGMGKLGHQKACSSPLAG